MKTKIALFGLLLFTFSLTAKNHLPASKTIVGMWRQTGAMATNGKLIKVSTGNYKVFNADGTYYTFIANDINSATYFGLYGSYKFTTDSTFTENIVKHANQTLNGTKATIRYKITDENTMVLLWESNGRWIPEMWTRIKFNN